MPLLDQIADNAGKEPVEMPRLTVGQTFLHYDRLGKGIERILEAYKDIPQAAPQECGERLKEIIKQAEGVVKTAARLLEANR